MYTLVQFSTSLLGLDPILIHFFNIDNTLCPPEEECKWLLLRATSCRTDVHHLRSSVCLFTDNLAAIERPTSHSVSDIRLPDHVLDLMTPQLTMFSTADHLQIHRRRCQTRWPGSPDALGCCEQAASADDHLNTSVAKHIGCEGPSTPNDVRYKGV